MENVLLLHLNIVVNDIIDLIEDEVIINNSLLMLSTEKCLLFSFYLFIEFDLTLKLCHSISPLPETTQPVIVSQTEFSQNSCIICII